MTCNPQWDCNTTPARCAKYPCGVDCPFNGVKTFSGNYGGQRSRGFERVKTRSETQSENAGRKRHTFMVGFFKDRKR